MDAKDEIKQKLTVEEVIADYLELRPAGRNLKALSPFSSEKTPSFMVSPDKQIWHDFSSNKGGDMFSFVMEVEAVDFLGALEILARKANVDLSNYRGAKFRNANVKKRLLAANQLAARYYHATLSKNTVALKYLKHDRNLKVETIKLFQLGYAPQAGKALVEFLIKRGFSENELIEAGLATNRWGGLKDLFRGRIMIPLADGQGNVIGFTGRLLSDDVKAPKYLNTPQTIIYDKSRHIFGLHLARESIRESGQAVVVEGNMDVIGSHQAGVSQVVATAGTAMTTHHLRGLQRITSDIRLCFDSDRAGQAAALRAIELAQDVGVSLSMITLPAGIKDPDELASGDVGAWKSAVDGAEYVIDWAIKYYENQYDIKTATGKRNFSNSLVDILKRLRDPVEQSHYIKKIAKKLDVSEVSLQRKLSTSATEVTKKKIIQGSDAVVPDEMEVLQDNLLALGAVYSDLRELIVQIPKSYFRGEDRQKLLDFLESQVDNPSSLLPKDLPIDDNYAKIIVFKAEQLYSKLSAQARNDVTNKLKTRMLAQYYKLQKHELTKQIEAAEKQGDFELAQKLLKDYQELLNKL